MAKTFECRQAGLGWGFRSGDEGEEAVLTKAVAHARARPWVDPAHSQTLERYVGEDSARRGGI